VGESTIALAVHPGRWVDSVSQGRPRTAEGRIPQESKMMKVAGAYHEVEELSWVEWNGRWTDIRVRPLETPFSD
jgi:hypothetical protein